MRINPAPSYSHHTHTHKHTHPAPPSLWLLCINLRLEVTASEKQHLVSWFTPISLLLAGVGETAAGFYPWLLTDVHISSPLSRGSPKNTHHIFPKSHFLRSEWRGDTAASSLHTNCEAFTSEAARGADSSLIVSGSQSNCRRGKTAFLSHAARTAADRSADENLIVWGRNVHAAI